jgi:glucokinase
MADSLRGGIDLGGTKVQAVVVDDAHEVRGSARRPTPTSGGPPDVVEAMAAALEEAATQAGVKTAKLRGVGAGSPGVIDPQAGTVAQADNLPDWQKPFPLAKKLSEQVGSPVALGNDVSVATQAEFELGAGRPYTSLLGVFWGTGVGGGLILGGKPWHGRGAAGEIGHMVVKRGGALCPCGRRGCMEAYAGRRAMEERARELHDAGTKTDLFKIMKKGGRERLTSGVWERAADQKDKVALELIERAVHALGTGIASALNLVDVEAVVLGGGLGMRFGVTWMDRLVAEMTSHLLRDSDPPGVHVAALGDLGGAIGASLLIT